MNPSPSTYFILAGLLLLSACNLGVAAPTDSAMQEVAIYAYDPAQDLDDQGNILCSAAGLVALPRTVEAGLTGELRLRAVVEMQLSGGLTEEELGRGLTTEFPLEGVELVDASLEGGRATITLLDPQFRTSGGACGVGILRGQVEAAVGQLPGVSQVHLVPETLFQP